jgi:hypothetical protein
MGCLLSIFRRKSDEDEVVIELGSATNAAVTCKCGAFGPNVKAITDSATNNISIEGSGIALGSCPLDCDTAYWEVKIGPNPANICLGVKRYNAKKAAPLTGTLLDNNPDDNFILKLPTGTELKSGDVVGIFWDQTDLPMLSFALNGVDLPSASYTRIRPAQDITPAVSVCDGAICQFVFDGNHFTHPPKSCKFKMIVCATSLI